MAGGWPRRHPRDKACAWQAPGGLPGLGRHRGTDRSPGVVGHLQAPWWLSLRSAVSRVTVSLLGAWFPLCPRGPSGPGVAGACTEGSPLLGQQWTRRGGSETAGPSTEPVSSTRLQCWGFAVTGALWGTAVGTVQAPDAARPRLQPCRTCSWATRCSMGGGSPQGHLPRPSAVMWPSLPLNTVAGGGAGGWGRPGWWGLDPRSPCPRWELGQSPASRARRPTGRPPLRELRVPSEHLCIFTEVKLPVVDVT